MKYILQAILPLNVEQQPTEVAQFVASLFAILISIGVSPGVDFILGVLSLCPSFWLCLCRQDLGGYAVCHSACETDTKSFSCDLFELMVQNIVKHPAHPEAISKVHWADTNGLWYTSMVKTHTCQILTYSHEHARAPIYEPY